MILIPMEQNVRLNLQPIREGEAKTPVVDPKGEKHQVATLHLGLSSRMANTLIYSSLGDRG